LSDGEDVPFGERRLLEEPEGLLRHPHSSPGHRLPRALAFVGDVDHPDPAFLIHVGESLLFRHRRHPTFSTRTRSPPVTPSNTLGSPSIRPNTLTGLAGRISTPRLAGVGP